MKKYLSTKYNSLKRSKKDFLFDCKRENDFKTKYLGTFFKDIKSPICFELMK